MSGIGVILIVVAAGGAAIGLHLSTRKHKPALRMDPLEERLARKLARTVGCTIEQALPAVRREIDIAPHQTEETLLKRATYHYRQDLPEKACPVYRDRKAG